MFRRDLRIGSAANAALVAAVHLELAKSLTETVEAHGIGRKDIKIKHVID